MDLWLRRTGDISGDYH